MIPRVDAQALAAGNAEAESAVRVGVSEVGFLTVHNTGLDAARITDLLTAYRSFFLLPTEQKAAVDMSRTGSNRGWGGAKSEQVDPSKNPDFKEVFDCGLELAPGDPVADLGLPAYAPNLWPDAPEGFAETVRAYYDAACGVALNLLRDVAGTIGEDRDFFVTKFNKPMTLLRGNYYPPRPDWAGADDFGIAAHTDYGCLTLLATDGTPGLEVQLRSGEWMPVQAPPGEFIINFGEMLEIWTGGRVRATPHRVVGGSDERLSVPLFFNPNHDTNVAPIGSGDVVTAVDHLQRRYDETYLHLQRA